MDSKISNLTALTTPAADDELAIVDTSATSTKKITHTNLLKGTTGGTIILGGNITASDKSITGLDTLTFTDVDGTIAGIANKNLVDKSATEAITGTWTFSAPVLAGNLVAGDNSITGIDTLTFTDVSGTVAGIANGNLVDKSAVETIAGVWDFSAIPTTSAGDPSTDNQLARKAYVDTKTASLQFFFQSDNIGFGDDHYMVPYGHFNTALQPTESDARVLVGIAGTVENMYVNADSSNLNGNTVITARKNGADQALTVTLGASATTGSDTAHTFVVAAGDILTVSADAEGSSGSIILPKVAFSLTT